MGFRGVGSFKMQVNPECIILGDAKILRGGGRDWGSRSVCCSSRSRRWLKSIHNGLRIVLEVRDASKS